MQIIYFNKYREKKDNKTYANLKDELNRIEKRISKAESINDLTFYQNIDGYRKIIRFGDSKGGYRLALFFYEDYCLIVDFDKKQNLENKTSESLFKNYDNKYFISYILNNTLEKREELLELNDYDRLLNLNNNKNHGEVCLESMKFSEWIEKYPNKKEVFDILQKNIISYGENEKYLYHKTIYKVSSPNFNIYYKVLVDNDVTILFLMMEDDNLKEIDKITSKNELLKRAIKSYPLEIFLEESEEWIENVIKNSDGNIALSPEEESILIELKSYNKEKYPFFINGRAGSGKSTILQYLFADYVVEFLDMIKEKDLQYTPIYLTYNNRLKEKAIEKVISIILSNTDSSLKEKLNLKNKNAIRRQIEGFFKSFDTNEGVSFLEEILYINNKDNPFKDKQKIKFEDIRDYFDNLLKKSGKKYKNFTPELIWYVIRSYIKGRGIIQNDKLKPLTPNEYKNLNRKLKTIKDEIFERVYNEFYKTYERYLKDNNYYDDLDLIFEVYRQNAFNKKYSVIFCDEAQDFTKVEFDLILNLNIFLSDNVKKDNISPDSIPIVFAGDPFQTINPTGFSFEYLKALVYESYDKKGMPANLNYKELQYNYRSNDEIIKFSNLIQVLRGVMFNEKNIKLQARWLDNIPTTSSILYVKEDLDFNTSYQFVFPTKKIEYFKNDKLFKSLNIEKIDTPIDIKGLEYPIIVLYRFGDFYVENYDEIKNFIENGFKDKESSLKYEYFFNNFYVAITRAKEKIIIVDSIRAKEKFWDDIDVDLLYKKFKEMNPLIRKDELLTYKEANKEDLTIDKDKEIIYTIDKLKTDIFERYDNEKNKIFILNEIEKTLKLKKLNQVYEKILRGLKNENQEGYLSAVKHLVEAAKEGSKNGELSKQQVAYLYKKSFNNLLKSVVLENPSTLEFLEKYKEEFVSLGIKYEERVSLLEKFLKQDYSGVLEYIKDTFEIIDMDKVLKYIILKSLENVEDYELYAYTKDLYNKQFLTKEEIINLIKSKMNKKNYRTLLKVFEIDGLKREFKDIYCKINLEVHPKDVDCLVFKNSMAEVLELIDEGEDIEKFNPYYKQILYAISKMNRLDLLDRLDFDLIVETYINNYSELSKEIWKYILERVFMNLDEDLLVKVMKFFEDKNKKVKREHLEILVQTLNKEVKNKIVFNRLITLFWDISIDVCDMIYALEHTADFNDMENIKKLLGYYLHYLSDKKNKYKGLIGSRYIVIRYFYDKEDRDFMKEGWFDVVKGRVKFLKVNSSEKVIRQIPHKLDREVCKKIVNLKYVDDIYKKILEEKNKESGYEVLGKHLIEENQKPEYELEKGVEKEEKKDNVNQNEKVIISKDTIVDILEEIQDYVSENEEEFSKKDIIKIFNAVAGLKEEIEKIKEKKS